MKIPEDAAKEMVEALFKIIRNEDGTVTHAQQLAAAELLLSVGVLITDMGDE